MSEYYYYQQPIKRALPDNFDDQFIRLQCDNTWIGESLFDLDHSHQDTVRTIEQIKNNHIPCSTAHVEVNRFIEYKGNHKNGWHRKGDHVNEAESFGKTRRQLHIKSEQRRRTQIKKGFEDLKSFLPVCHNKKPSKVIILSKTVQQLKHMKNLQDDLITEVEKLLKENADLRQNIRGFF